MRSEAARDSRPAVFVVNGRKERAQPGPLSFLARMCRPEILLPAVVGLGAPAGLARAAEAKVAVGATLGASTQRAGDSDSPYLGPGFGGTRPAATLFADAAVAPRVRVGAEFSLAGALTGTQHQRTIGGTNLFVSEHRDTVASLTARIRLPGTGRVQLAFVAGGGLAFRKTSRSGSFVILVPPFDRTPFREDLSDRVWAFTGGGDGVLPVSRRLALLAQLRVHALRDDDRNPDGVVHRGVSSLIFRFGLGAQLGY